MKFPEHKLFMETVRLPSPVQKWFGHQLEIRGIDSVIYSRHIIHLLQQDDDEIQDYVDLFFDSKAEKKHQCKAARYDKKKVKNSEERKKSAAIECLQAVSDEDNDIETLVEELCHKLKNLEQHDEGNATNSQEATTSSSESDSSSSELENPAERYYAAFPALHGKDQNSTPNESQSVWKNNPITKPKADQTGEIEAESSQEELHPKHHQQEQLSPKTLNRKKKKQTVKKLHAKRTPSRKEDSCYRVCHFLSWPNGSLNIENPATQAHSLQDQELCSQVETMLKEMLLHKEEQALKMPSPEGRMRKPLFVGDRAWENSPEGTDGSVSPELQEDDSWYTQPIDILFTSEEPRQRLYKRNNSSSASPYQQRSGSISPVSPNDSLNQQSLNESPKENQFLFPYSSSDTSETKNCFPPAPTFFLFNQSEPKAIPSQNSDLNPDMSGFSVLSPFDNLPQAAPSSEREERYRANSFTENISNSLSLTTVSDLEDINKGVDDLDFDINLTSPENLLDHQYMEQFLSTANDQEVYYWDNNLQSFDGFLPWTMATTWPSKVLVDDLMPDVSWEERYEGYSADFYNHLKLGKIWQVWDVNYQKITGAYCSPWKNLLQTCWSDHGLFGMSNQWDPDTHRQQADIWGNYGICSESTSWGNYGKLKDSYQQSWLDDGPGTLETPDDSIPLEDPCNPLVMVDVDQDSMVCQIENQNSELIPQIQFDLVSETGSEYDNVLSDGENDQLSNTEEEQNYCRSVSYGDFQTMWSMVEHSTPKKFSLSQSFELVPSERSAFVDVVPKKIHHVQSEPNLVTQERDSLSASVSKSRSCKSDSSSPEEHLYFSQKTHFQPIQSPVAQYTGSTYNLRDLFGGYAPSKTPYQKFQKNAYDEADDDEEESFVPMFKIRKDQDKYIQTSESLDNCAEDKDSIEYYNNQADFQELENGGQVFDLFGYVDNLTECLESTPQNLLDCVNNYVDSGYEDIDQPVQDREEADRSGFYGVGIFEKKNRDPWSTENGFQSKNNRNCGEGLSIGGNWQSKISAPVNENTRKPLDESKHGTCSCGKVADFENWEENTSKIACVCKPPVHRWVIQEAWGLNPGSGGEMEAATKHSIWSSGYEDGAFSEMFYYPGQDEESVSEQFKVQRASSKVEEHSEDNGLNLFEYNQDLVSDENGGNCRMGSEKISDQTNSYQAEFDPYGQSFMEMTSYFRDDISDPSKARPDQHCVGQIGKENHPPPKNESDIVKVKLVIKKGKKKQDFENLDTHPPLFKPMPVAAVYSCELEHAWMNNMEVEYLFPQSSSSKGKKKPCTFFLEGNCRRTDCKFAHDLSHITCRFWEEGDCFKGELCPFLHGYSPYKRHVSERKDSKQFQFEADDFPNLTKSESKKDRAKKDKYHKLNKYKASKTQLRTQINKKIQKNNVIQESTASLSKKLKQKGSQ